MSHTLSAPLLSRLSSLSAELSELCGLCDLLADPMPRNFVFVTLRTLSDMAEDASETLEQLADEEENPRRRILPSLLDGYARNLAFVPPVMEALAAASDAEQRLALEWIGHLTDKWVSAAGRLATETAKELEAQPLEVLA